MESKTIKISKENYLWLLKLAGDLQKEEGRIISFDDAINKLKSKKMKKTSILEFAGRWKMSDEEAEKLKKDLRKGYKKWKIPSF